jgi:hypothetical protein
LDIRVGYNHVAKAYLMRYAQSIRILQWALTGKPLIEFSAARCNLARFVLISRIASFAVYPALECFLYVNGKGKSSILTT